MSFPFVQNHFTVSFVISLPFSLSLKKKISIGLLYFCFDLPLPFHLFFFFYPLSSLSPYHLLTLKLVYPVYAISCFHISFLSYFLSFHSFITLHHSFVASRHFPFCRRRDSTFLYININVLRIIILK